MAVAVENWVAMVDRWPREEGEARVSCYTVRGARRCGGRPDKSRTAVRVEDGGQSSVNGCVDFLESECSSSPKETRQAISANTAVQRSTLERDAVRSDMRLFVVRNGAGNWSQMSASDKVTGDGVTGRWDHNVDRGCEPNGAWSVRWCWCWEMGRGCDRDRCRVRWGGYLDSGETLRSGRG
jgi:hypothetical protein